MYKTIYPTRDATLYSRHPERNTGVDQILELTKVPSGSTVDDLSVDEYWDTTLLSRIILDFDISEISASVASGDMVNPKFFLTIKATEAMHLPIEYTIYAHPLSASWTNGTGYYNNDREVKNGASWKYRHGKLNGTEWSNYGGDYYTQSQYQCTENFNYEMPDIRMNVTPIINGWINGDIPQHGIILKHSDAAEQDNTDLGFIKFFSKDTHTVYIPRLEAYWDSTVVSGTGSISAITDADYIAYIKNLKESYYEDEVAKLRIGVRQRFVTASYAATSGYRTTRRFPGTAFYQIMDSRTDEVIIHFDDPGTKVSCDTNGNFIIVDMNSLLPERFYRIVFRVEYDDQVNYVDEGFWFKVVRR